MAEDKDAPPVTIKKYANRRLYNTATSSYVTLGNLAELVKEGVDFVVVDARTGEDITRAVLTQIIFEEESKGTNLLPISFLRQLIGFYGDSLQSLVPRYLDHTMRAFAQNQEAMRQNFTHAVGDMFPFGRWEEIGKQNMAMFERAMQMWASPFSQGADASSTSGDAPNAAAESQDSEDLGNLRKQLDALQRQVDDLTRDKDDA